MRTKLNEPSVHIGLDDVDSRLGGCTTYTSALVVERLVREGAVFTDYPNLIRLNPNVPWKTKGNGAVALRFRHAHPERTFDLTCEYVRENSEIRSGDASPGVVMLVSDEIPEALQRFSYRSLVEILPREMALRLIRNYGLSHRGFGGGRGLIGAVAALGNRLEKDHTYELIAYRRGENWGTVRRVSASSVVKMDKMTGSKTFNNYDYEEQRVLITPRGPDPVLLGIRGESPQTVLEAYDSLSISEPVERHLVFRTNQGTDGHLRQPLDPRKLKPHGSGHLTGHITATPHIEIGGHVYFKLGNHGWEVDCAVYEPARNFRKTVLELIPRDFVEVGGGVRLGTSRHPWTLNVEYLRVLKIARKLKLTNPFCRKCGKRMESQGKSQPLRCRGCGHEDKEAGKIIHEEARKVSEGLYLPPSGSQRHLAKPIIRYGLEKTLRSGRPVGNWLESRKPAPGAAP